MSVPNSYTVLPEDTLILLKKVESVAGIEFNSDKNRFWFDIQMDSGTIHRVFRASMQLIEAERDQVKKLLGGIGWS